MPTDAATLDLLCVNTIRGLSIDGVQKANSGHPGLPMGAAAFAYALWNRHLKHNPKNPHWFDRDRFVLSAGHGSMLLYSLLHLTGYDLSIDDLKSFRQLNSRTAGHPEYHLTPGVEVTTGPLGDCYRNLGLYSQAIEIYEHIATYSSFRSEYCTNLVIIFEEAGMFDFARKIARRHYIASRQYDALVQYLQLLFRDESYMTAQHVVVRSKMYLSSSHWKQISAWGASKYGRKSAHRKSNYTYTRISSESKHLR